MSLPRIIAVGTNEYFDPETVLADLNGLFEVSCTDDEFEGLSLRRTRTRIAFIVLDASYVFQIESQQSTMTKHLKAEERVSKFRKGCSTQAHTSPPKQKEHVPIIIVYHPMTAFMMKHPCEQATCDMYLSYDAFSHALHSFLNHKAPAHDLLRFIADAAAPEKNEPHGSIYSP